LENQTANNSLVDFEPLIKNRNFIILMSGQFVSTFGSSLSQIIIPLLILTIYKSPGLAGIVGGIETLPYLAFSLLAGVITDRWNQKRVMIVSEIIRAFNIATIPISLIFGSLSLTQLVVNALVEGTCFVFFQMAESSVSVTIVGNRQITHSATVNEVIASFSPLVGPALGGYLFGVARAIPFLIDAITFVYSFMAISLIRMPDNKERLTDPQPRLSIKKDIGEGVKWLREQPVLLGLAVLNATLTFALTGESLLVMVQLRNLSASPTTIGLVFTIAGVGAIVGSMCGGYVKKNFRFGYSVLLLTWLFSLFMGCFAFAHSVWSIGVVFSLLLFIDPLYDVIALSYRYVHIPPHLLGRVNSVFRLIGRSLQPLGVALMGFSLQYLGTFITIITFTGVLAIVAVLFTFNSRFRTTQ